MLKLDGAIEFESDKCMPIRLLYADGYSADRADFAHLHDACAHVVLILDGNIGDLDDKEIHCVRHEKVELFVTRRWSCASRDVRHERLVTLIHS